MRLMREPSTGNTRANWVAVRSPSRQYHSKLYSMLVMAWGTTASDILALSMVNRSATTTPKLACKCSIER